VLDSDQKRYERTEITEMGFLTEVGGYRLIHKSNRHIREELRIFFVSFKILKNLLNWRRSNCLQATILLPIGRIISGRPAKRWKDRFNLEESEAGTGLSRLHRSCSECTSVSNSVSAIILTRK
jgi:hypothetical protein